VAARRDRLDAAVAVGHDPDAAGEHGRIRGGGGDGVGGGSLLVALRVAGGLVAAVAVGHDSFPARSGARRGGGGRERRLGLELRPGRLAAGGPTIAPRGRAPACRSPRVPLLLLAGRE